MKSSTYRYNKEKWNQVGGKQPKEEIDYEMYYDYTFVTNKSSYKNKLNSAIKSIRFKKRQQKIIQQLKDTSFGEL
jgi:hypothetical protein